MMLGACLMRGKIHNLLMELRELLNADKTFTAG